MLDSVWYDVQIEQTLKPLTGEVFPRSANSDDRGRLDISAKGFWQKDDKVFFNVRIFGPSPFAQEAAKKRDYNERVIRVEHGSFTPIVSSAYGGFGRETKDADLQGGQRSTTCTPA